MSRAPLADNLAIRPTQLILWFLHSFTFPFFSADPGAWRDYVTKWEKFGNNQIYKERRLGKTSEGVPEFFLGGIHLLTQSTQCALRRVHTMRVFARVSHQRWPCWQLKRHCHKTYGTCCRQCSGDKSQDDSFSQMLHLYHSSALCKCSPSRAGAVQLFKCNSNLFHLGLKTAPRVYRKN